MPAVMPIDERDDDRQRRELERYRELFEDQLAHRLLDAHRFAQIAFEHAARPIQVADRQRLIEVELLVQVRDHCRILVLAGEDQRRSRQAAAAAGRRSGSRRRTAWEPASPGAGRGS